MQHGWPKQAVEIDNVLADKVVKLGLRIQIPVITKIEVLAFTVVLETGEVADGGIQPHIKIFARCTRNFEAKIGRVAADVPLLQADFGPFTQFISNLGLQST